MKLVDANVLLYAVNSSAPQHERSRGWLDRSLSGGDTVGFAWMALLAFVRVSTKHEFFEKPLSVDEAMNQVESWITSASAVVLEPTTQHLTIVRSLLAPLGAGGDLVNDAHLAALSIEHRCTVMSFDHDFGRFAGVDWSTPPA
ncbi:MAG: type II toxin-antitoxin system VapC family toxin [Microthrixaceae bacterium]|nr:type II toxin-antitoxin system VapC family toxin [Microthrixaceae bacterium]